MKKILCMSLIVSVLCGSAVAFAEESINQDIIFFEDFESFQDEEKPVRFNNGISKVTYSADENSSVTVCRDEDDKALKYVVADSNDMQIPLGTVLGEGKYSLSMDVKFENDSRHFDRFFVPRNESWSALTWFQTAVGKWCPKWRGYGSETLIDGSETYHKVEIRIDIDNRKCDFYINDKFICTDNLKANGGIESIWFKGVNSTSNNGKSSGVGVYWFDNIKIAKLVLNVNETKPEIGVESAEVDDEIVIKFDKELNSQSVVESIMFFEDENQLTNDEYTVGVDKNTVTVKKNTGLLYDTDYRIEFSSKLASADGENEVIPERYTLHFHTKDLIPEMKSILEDGGVYNEGHKIILPENDGVEYKIYLTDSEEYTGEELSAGEYPVKLEAWDKKGRRQEKIYNIKIVGRVAPVAGNVKITGDAKTGAVLTGEYEYSDVNNDKEGESEFRWFRSKAAEGEWEEIMGETNNTYILTEADENCYIKFEVTPVAENEPSKGEAKESEPFMSDFKPVVSNIRLSGKMEVGETVTAEYDYSDANGDEEGESICGWFKAKEKDGDFSEKIADEKSITISENDINCYLQFKVTPKSKDSEIKAAEYCSEILDGIFAPKALGVKIIGEAKAGRSLGVSYTFFDANGDEEGETKISWLVDGNEVSEKGTYKLTSADVGKEIICIVTPVSEKFPFEGESARSESVKINKASSGSSGGSGGGGGFSGTSAGNTPVIIPEKNDKPKQEDKEPLKFRDLDGHWAKDAIEKLYEKEIVNGVTEDLFMPEKELTRAECAAMLVRALSIEKAEETNFSDVFADAWYYDIAGAVSSAGIMQGDNGAFRPDDGVTREELAVILSRIAKGTEKETGIDFKDEEEISDWAKDGVETAVRLGLVKGDEKGNFMPKKIATRAQMAVCIERILNMEVSVK